MHVLWHKTSSFGQGLILQLNTSPTQYMIIYNHYRKLYIFPYHQVEPLWRFYCKNEQSILTSTVYTYLHVNQNAAALSCGHICRRFIAKKYGILITQNRASVCVCVYVCVHEYLHKSNSFNPKPLPYWVYICLPSVCPMCNESWSISVSILHAIKELA